MNEEPLPPGATTAGRQRVDRWLWAARFFRARTLARQAVLAGRVEVNGVRAKPARAVAPGDRLHIRCPAGLFEVDVLALNEQRRPAPEAFRLYRELAASAERRRRRAEVERLERAEVVHDRARPDRRARRSTIRFRRDGGS